MNFAEELVYWYLRLNGFFPITNFVLHRDEGYPSGEGRGGALSGGCGLVDGWLLPVPGQ